MHDNFFFFWGGGWVLTINFPVKWILKKLSSKMSKYLSLPALTPIPRKNINKRIYLFTHPDSFLNFSSLYAPLCNFAPLLVTNQHHKLKQFYPSLDSVQSVSKSKDPSYQ